MPMGFCEIVKRVEDDEVMKYTLWGMIAEAQGDVDNTRTLSFHVSNQERPTVCSQLLSNYVGSTIKVAHARAYLELAEGLAPMQRFG